MRSRLDPGLLAAILAGPGVSRSVEPGRIFDPYGINNVDPVPTPEPERIPAGQCRGCRARISANKDYCLKCATELDAAPGGGAA